MDKTILEEQIIYKLNPFLDVEDLADLFLSSGINRPIEDKLRLRKMLIHAKLIYTAWHNNKLVGVARSLTDFSYCCFLSDLAVRKEYQHLNIDKKLIELTQAEIGEQCMLMIHESASIEPISA